MIDRELRRRCHSAASFGASLIRRPGHRLERVPSLMATFYPVAFSTGLALRRSIHPRPRPSHRAERFGRSTVVPTPDVCVRSEAPQLGSRDGPHAELLQRSP